MNRKAQTIDLKGSDYARVPERLKLFREDCPNGSIKTTHEFLEDGRISFLAYILKDKSKPNSADATGHSLGGVKANKDYEKLETIAVGRALAMLGYLAGGEIASSEEMEYKDELRLQSIAKAIKEIRNTKTLDELKQVFFNQGLLIKEKEVVEAKNMQKVSIETKSNKKVKK